MPSLSNAHGLGSISSDAEILTVSARAAIYRATSSKGRVPGQYESAALAGAFSVGKTQTNKTSRQNKPN